jgi:hypothetical protein
MVELKVAAAHFRRYRDRLGKWTTTLGTVKAVASCGGIAGWAVWKVQERLFALAQHEAREYFKTTYDVQ